MKRIKITCKGQKYIDINQLVNFQGNLKELSRKKYNKLKNLIIKYGFSFPVFVWKDHNEIIDGHQRVLVVKDMAGKGYTIDKIPVVEIEAKDKQEVAEKLLALNSKFGKMTDEGLYEFINTNDVDFENIYKDLELTDINIDKFLTGFLKDETKDDDVPHIDEDVEPQSKLGDIYELGEHRVMCGDSTSEQDVGKLMAGRKADMVFTDPPYNVDYKGGADGTKGFGNKKGIMNDKMSKEAFYQFLTGISKRIVENTVGCVYICMSSSELDALKMAWTQNGGHWQTFIIWVKNNFTLSRADYQNTYEPILYGWPSKIKHHYFINERNDSNVWEDLRSVRSEFKDGYTTISFQGFKVRIKGKVKKGQVIKKRQKVDIWRYDKPMKSELHPTMKPVALIENAILNSSERGGIVLDLFLGSGSTLIAAEKTGRVCYGMELDPHYCDVIVQRWVDYTGIDEIKKNGKAIRWQLQ